MNPEFMQIVDQLAIWKFFPSGKDRGTLAIKLAEWCDGQIERARWLITRVDEFDEYPGPATLRALIRDKFNPAGCLAPYNLERSVSEVLPPLECEQCNDTGTLMIDGLHAWCTCDTAKQLCTEIPNWVRFSNQYRGTRPSRLTEELRAAEVQRKLAHLEGGYGTEKAS